MILKKPNHKLADFMRALQSKDNELVCRGTFVFCPSEHGLLSGFAFEPTSVDSSLRWVSWFADPLFTQPGLAGVSLAVGDRIRSDNKGQFELVRVAFPDELSREQAVEEFYRKWICSLRPHICQFESVVALLEGHGPLIQTRPWLRFWTGMLVCAKTSDWTRSEEFGVRLLEELHRPDVGKMDEQVSVATEFLERLRSGDRSNLGQMLLRWQIAREGAMGLDDDFRRAVWK